MILSFMGDLLTTLLEALSTMGGGIVDFVKTAFTDFLYVDPAATDLVVSDIALFSFGLLGLSLAISLSYWVMHMIKR